MYLINERNAVSTVMIIMENEINKSDGLEVFVKVKIGISLTKEEKDVYNHYDDEEKRIIFTFIENPAFSENLKSIEKKIYTKNRIQNK